MFDIEKLFEKAEKLLQKQKFESALETYEEINAFLPGQEKVLLQLGDLCLMVNRTAEGLRFQSQLVDLYIRRNDISKAVATSRKILKVSPQDAGTLMKMAALLEKSEKTSEALEAYRDAAKLHSKARATAKALECLERIVELDPNNLEAHVELAEEASEAHQPKRATSAFLRAAELAREAGQEDRWATLAQRAHALDPTDPGACRATAQVLLKKGRAKEVITLLEPLIQTNPNDFPLLELLSRAYLQAGEFAKAEPACWRLYQARPESADLLLRLAEGFSAAGKMDKALALVGQLKGRVVQPGTRDEFLKTVEKIYQADESNLGVLETLTQVYDELNQEEGLRRSLARLFNFHLAAEHYQEAANTLERIIDVDPYGHGHYDRLLSLEGHIEKAWYESMVARVEPTSGGGIPAGGTEEAKPAPTQEAESLDELIVEGEMYHRYQLAAKLTGTLEKINRLFPNAEEANPRLRELYDAAGFIPTPAPGVPAPAAAAAPQPPVPRPGASRAASASLESLEDLKKISEITANVYRESTPQGVMQVAVNEIGGALNASRCWGALGAPDRPATLTVEYCSPAVPHSEVGAMLKLYSVLIRQAASHPEGWQVEDVGQFPPLAAMSSEIQKVAIKSLLALPLLDREQLSGLLLVEQCDRRRGWAASQVLLVKSIGTQVMIAVDNTKLRRLVRSLAGSDEESGLFPRSSYLDCLLAEAQRAKELSQPLSVCLLEPENPTAVIKSLGDVGMQRYFQKVAKTLRSNLRQNDIAIRYNPCSIAVVFPDTALPQGGLAVEKLRKVISQVKMNGAAPPDFCGAVCDVQLGANFDAVDGVTELINRLEAALARARKEGRGKVFLSRFEG